MKYNTEEIKKYMAEHKVSRSTAVRHLYPKKAAVAPAVDVKRAAANDKPEAAPAPTMTPEERGKARAEGLRLFKLAGRPKKSDFVKVYGKRGHLMTWTQRAEAGIPAEKFQAALRKAAR
jgi:hypothetical protein